jgi:predicted TIM-barrel fold metal-dependent hydrolase
MIIDSAVCLADLSDPAPLMAWLDQMARHAIAHAVVAPADAYAAVYNEEGNDLLADVVRRYPQQLSGLAVANPWLGPKAASLLEKAFDAGLKGLFLCPPRQGFRLTESVVDPLLEVCQHRRKPVYAYTGTPICSEPFQLAELARRFPEVTFIMGHAAYPDFWYDVTAALQQAPNMLVETSCQMTGVLQQAIDAIGPERVLFGSGWPRSKPGIEIMKMQSMGLPAETMEKIMHANASRCWGITP